MVMSNKISKDGNIMGELVNGELKKNTEKIMSICLTWFPISGLGEPNI